MQKISQVMSVAAVYLCLAIVLSPPATRGAGSSHTCSSSKLPGEVACIPGDVFIAGFFNVNDSSWCSGDSVTAGEELDTAVSFGYAVQSVNNTQVLGDLSIGTWSSIFSGS